MDLTKLKNMYRSADPRKLNQMLSEAIEYGDKAEVLKRKKRSIIENLISTVGEKFPKKTDEERWDRDRGSAQLKQMETQWRICAASMVTVKRSIKLSGFHSQGEGGSQNLYANSKYGIKVHKRYSGYSPFYFIDIMKHCDDPAPFKITVNMLHMTNINSGVLNFAVLDSIPQLDTERVDLLKGITQETVWLIDSWRNFYRKMDVSRIKRIDEINDMNQYNVDENKLKMVIKDLPMLIKFNKQLDSNISRQEAKWQPTIDKWKEHNKNFMVLKELSKGELKV